MAWLPVPRRVRRLWVGTHVGQIDPVTGTINATSNLSGDITGSHVVTGTINATSSFSGAIVRQRPIVGTVNATSSLSGKPVVQRVISGTINATSSLSTSTLVVGHPAGPGLIFLWNGGQVFGPKLIAGTFNSTSTISGAVLGLGLVTGTINARSDLSGAIIGGAATTNINLTLVDPNLAQHIIIGVR